jgi:hypothetical protein
MLRRFIVCVCFLFSLAHHSVCFSATEGKELHLSFDQAENEVLGRFQQDIPRIESITNKVAIYEVTVSGTLPDNYSDTLRSKLGRLILTSNRLRLIDCPQCQVARLVKDEKGELRYESTSEEKGRPGKMASEVGVKELLYAELNYSSSDVTLRIRVVSASDQEILWTGEYSTSGLVRDRGKLVNKEYNYEVLTNGDSLSQMIIGEIAFSMVFSPGVLWIPTIDEGSGSQRLFYPSIDIVIGEKFDSGYKRFGFLFGAAANAAEGAGIGRALPFVIRVAPQFRYTFNPYNTSFARISIAGEMGGLISTGLATAYVGFGPEVTMVKRFSVSLTPMYMLPTTVKGGRILVAGEQGLTSQAQPDQGKFGGFALLLKGSMNW